jgi:DNA-binding NtrC family response regulator
MARILVIDDDGALRKMLSATLAHFGHVVIEAKEGKEGLALFRISNVDLVLTDMVMPEMEGFEVLTELKGKFPSMKVIAMSGGGRLHSMDYLKMAELLGAAEVLPKPFSSETLMATINRQLSANKPAAASNVPT